MKAPEAWKRPDGGMGFISVEKGPGPEGLPTAGLRETDGVPEGGGGGDRINPLGINELCKRENL